MQNSDPNDSMSETTQANSIQRTLLPPFVDSKFSSMTIFLDNLKRFCDDEKLNETEKKKILPQCLTGDNFKFYYDNRLNELSFDRASKFLIEVFDITRKEEIQIFHSLQFRQGDDLIQFFTKKLSLAKRLGFDDPTTIEYLTLALPKQYQRFMLMKDISTPTEWISIVRQLQNLSDSPSQENNFRAERPWYGGAFRSRRPVNGADLQQSGSYSGAHRDSRPWRQQPGRHENMGHYGHSTHSDGQNQS